MSRVKLSHQREIDIYLTWAGASNLLPGVNVKSQESHQFDHWAS